MVRTAGVQLEMELAFAGLHQMSAPMLDHLEAIPVPQGVALRTALGLSPGPPPDQFLAGLAVLGLLARVAEETGGGYTEVRLNQDLGAAFAHVADELHSQYLIGYAPPKKDGKVHKIEVKVNQRGMEPRARKTYVAAKS